MSALPTTDLTRLDAHRLRDWLRDGPGVVLLPTGATEQHGPHLPIGTDAILSHAMATAVAERIGAVVAPPLSYGYKSQPRSGGGNHLSGTVSLSAASLIAMTRDVIGSLLAQGARSVAVVNGHFENYQFLYEGADLALADARRDDASVLLLSYWDYVDEDTLATVYPDGFPGWAIEHGGVLETSLMWHLHPELVDTERMPQHPAATQRRLDRLPIVPEWTPDSGCLSAPTGSSPEHGELLLRVAAEGMAGDLAAELPALRTRAGAPA